MRDSDKLQGADSRRQNDVSFGINVCASLMYPCSREMSQVLSVSHISGVVIINNNKHKGNE